MMLYNTSHTYIHTQIKGTDILCFVVFVLFIYFTDSHINLIICIVSDMYVIIILFGVVMYHSLLSCHFVLTFSNSFIVVLETYMVVWVMGCGVVGFVDRDSPYRIVSYRIVSIRYCTI